MNLSVTVSTTRCAACGHLPAEGCYNLSVWTDGMSGTGWVICDDCALLAALARAIGAAPGTLTCRRTPAGWAAEHPLLPGGRGPVVPGERPTGAIKAALAATETKR
jgi:hypothetical protein